jgi:hypothetical protein
MSAQKYDEAGFGEDDGLHRDTGTMFNPEGFDCDGRDDEGYDVNGYNESGFNRDGINRRTGNEFDIYGHTEDGSRYNEDGYDCNGYDEEGYNEEGYDSEGFDSDGIHCDTGTEYNEDGYDVHGNEQEADDDGFDDGLRPYEECVIEATGWRHPTGRHDTLLAGHEIEMYSRDCDLTDVANVVNQLARAYRKHAPTVLGGSKFGHCAIGKHDGSLGEDGRIGGFETVTVPLTREQTYGIFESFDVLGDGECKAWSMGPEVGHHIHLSLSAISPLTLGKMGVFLNEPGNRRFIEAVAQRGAIYNGFENNKKLTHPKPYVRHSVMNVTPQTVEFRMFKSNLRSSGILKNYEFAISTVRFCREASAADLNFTHYLRFLAAHRKEFRYMHQFMLQASGVVSIYDGRKWCDVYASFVPQNGRRANKPDQAA